MIGVKKEEKRKILVVEDVPRWERLFTERLHQIELVVVRSVGELEEVLSSGQKFFAVALDGWLGEESTVPFIPQLKGLSNIVVATSHDIGLRKEMMLAGCQVGGCKWEAADLLALFVVVSE